MENKNWDRFKRGLYNTFRGDVDIDYGIKGYPDEFISTGYNDLVIPCIDIYRSGENLVIDIDMPGVNKEDIDINVNENEIEVRAKKEYDETDEDFYYLQTERTETGFYRRVGFPEKVDESRAVAAYENGVLKITLPIVESTKKSINIS